MFMFMFIIIIIIIIIIMNDVVTRTTRGASGRPVVSQMCFPFHPGGVGQVMPQYVILE